MASPLDVKTLAFADRNSTIEWRVHFQLSQRESICSGRKSPSLRYQYCFIPQRYEKKKSGNKKK